jgi:hypothetical protein
MPIFHRIFFVFAFLVTLSCKGTQESRVTRNESSGAIDAPISFPGKNAAEEKFLEPEPIVTLSSQFEAFKNQAKHVLRLNLVSGKNSLFSAAQKAILLQALEEKNAAEFLSAIEKWNRENASEEVLLTQCLGTLHGTAEILTTSECSPSKGLLFALPFESSSKAVQLDFNLDFASTEKKQTVIGSSAAKLAGSEIVFLKVIKPELASTTPFSMPQTWTPSLENTSSATSLYALWSAEPIEECTVSNTCEKLWITRKCQVAEVTEDSFTTFCSLKKLTQGSVSFETDSFKPAGMLTKSGGGSKKLLIW